MTKGEVIPEPTKVIPDLSRDPDLAEGVMMERQGNRFRLNNKAVWCHLGQAVPFSAEEQLIGNGFRVALRLPGMTK